MSLETSKTRLATLTRELTLKWEETRAAWRDAKSLEFERDYLVDLVSGVDKATAVVSELEKILQQVRHDCE